MDAGGSHADPVVRDARRKFSSALESNVLDYLHYAPAVLEACVVTLEKIFGNALDHPDDEKYRKIKIASRTYQDHIAAVKHAEELMLQAGWRPQVADLQRYLVLDHSPGSTGWAVLGEARDVLSQARATLHEKAERKRIEREERMAKDSEQRHKVLAAIEADRRERADRQQRIAEAAAAATAAAAAAEAAEAAKEAPASSPDAGTRADAGRPASLRSPGARGPQRSGS